MTKYIEHSLSQDKMHIIMPNTEQLMRDKLADSLEEFHQWTDLIRSGEAEVTGLTVKRKRTWVGLTDEEWLSLGCKSVEEVRIGLAIQAKLKEKNGL